MTAWPTGYQRLILGEIDSTNAEAARRAGAGERGPLWIRAEEQTLGRGRQGHGWTTGGGNFAASLLFAPDCTAQQGALYSFVTSLAVADTLAVLAPPAEVLLKWPNDVLVNGRKASGVLLESGGAPGGRLAWLIVGVGINLTSHPPADAIRPGGTSPTDLQAEGAAPVRPDDALTILAARFAHWRARYETCGFPPIRTAWLDRAARRGQTIAARLADSTIEGIFEDMDATGALVLRTERGRRTIAAAEVHFPEGV